MGIARRLAHLTYRGEAELDERFSNSPQTGEDPSPAAATPSKATSSIRRKTDRAIRSRQLCPPDRGGQSPRRRQESGAGSRRRCVAVPFPWSSAVSTRTCCFPCACRTARRGSPETPSAGCMWCIRRRATTASSPRPTRSPICCGTRPKSRGKPVRRTGTAVSGPDRRS